MSIYFWNGRESGFSEGAVGEQTEYDFTITKKCPNCGREISDGKWLAPRIVKMQNRLQYKKQIPDFINVWGDGLIWSERVVKAFCDMKLTGVKEFVKIDELRIHKKDKINPDLFTNYYSVKVFNSTLKLDRTKTRICYGEKTSYPKCELCNPAGFLEDCISRIQFQSETEVEYDVFSTYEMGSHVFYSQRFIDFCEHNHFVNAVFSAVDEFGIDFEDLFWE